MKISELHSPSRRFLRSAQLERDFSDPEALEGYVLTAEIETTVGRLMRGLAPTSGQRAWRVTGDYGSGKSSLALLLANLVSREATALPKHLRHLQRDPALAGGKQKLLPVLVTGAREPIALVLLRSLAGALDQNVDRRMALRSRTQIHEALQTPHKLEDTKVVKWVEAAARELHERGLYRGIFIVLDELGKLLEFAALNPERQDIYFLQQLAEISARSGEACLFTVGLLHQGFGVYAGKLSDAGQREWEKVAGRFEEVVFSQPLSQVATLAAAALEFKETPLLRGWKSKAHADMARAVELGMFGSGAPKTALSEIAPSLYPLHPTVLPVLAKFFRRFGQNERSLFSFLLSSEPFGLQSFNSQEASLESIYGLADFYDFAAQNFGHRLSTQSFRSHWNHIDGIIRSYPAEQGADLRILKTVGILNTIESPELCPTADVLALALDNLPGLQAALKRLTSRGILYLRGRSGGYALWPHTSVSLEQAFIRASEAISSVSSIAESIRDRLETRPIVASRHYIETGNLRYFEVVYTSSSRLMAETNLLRPEFPADGRIVVVLCETAEQQKAAEKFAGTTKGHEATLLGITSPLDMLTGLILELERWTWVERHTAELKDDRYAAEEVSRQLAVSTQALEKAMARHIGIRGAIEQSDSTICWFRDGGRDRGISAKGELQSALSDICDQLFQLAPHIQNELVNRHEISSAAAAARQKLFGLMLRNRREPMLGLPETKAPPEKSMYLSVLQSTGFHRLIDGVWDIRFPKAGTEKAGNVRHALLHVVALLERKPDARVNVQTIVDEMRRPPYGVRDGLTPLLLLMVLLEHETEIAVYEDGRFVPEIEEFLMMRLVKQPQTFEFQLTRITGVRRRLIEKFADVLAAHQTDRLELVAIVRPLCAAVAALPEYVHLTDRLSPPSRALRTEVLKSQEPAELVFGSIPRALGFKGNDKTLDAAAVAKMLAESLTELRRAFPDLQNRLAQVVLHAFGVEEMTLAAWRARIAPQAETVVVAVTDPDLRTFALKLSDEISTEGEWLESLGSFLVRRPPSRWRDQDETMFAQQFTDLAQRYLRVQATHFGLNASGSQEAIRIALTRKTGEEADRVVSLSGKQAKEAAEVRNLLQTELPKDKNVALAALSQLMWTLLKEKP